MKDRFHPHMRSDKSPYPNVSSTLFLTHRSHQAQTLLHDLQVLTQTLLITPPQPPVLLILWLLCNHSSNTCNHCSSKEERNKRILQESLSPSIFQVLTLSYVITPSAVGISQTFRQGWEKITEQCADVQLLQKKYCPAVNYKPDFRIFRIKSG